MYKCSTVLQLTFWVQKFFLSVKEHFVDLQFHRSHGFGKIVDNKYLLVSRLSSIYPYTSNREFY